MQENIFVLQEGFAETVKQPQQEGVGKSDLRVRLAPGMDEDFVQRLNRFCDFKPPQSATSNKVFKQ